jgi:type I restriction enzyme, R subunit
MWTKADTCRTLITPGLQAAGWEQEPPSLAEESTFMDSRIAIRGDRPERPALRDRAFKEGL